MYHSQALRDCRFSFLAWVGLSACLVAAATASAPSSGLAVDEADPAAEDPPLSIAAAFLGVASDSLVQVAGRVPDSAEYDVREDGRTVVRVGVNLDHNRLSTLYYVERVDPEPIAVSDVDRQACQQVATAFVPRIAPELPEGFQFPVAIATPSEAQCRFLVFIWEEKTSDTTYTGKMLLVRVAPRTREIVSASLFLPAPGPLPEPQVEKDVALRTAKAAAEAWSKDEVELGDYRLTLSHPSAPQRGPVWLVNFRTVKRGWSDTVCIDAVSGEVIFPQEGTAAGE